MTPETARILAQALKTRWEAEAILIGLFDTAPESAMKDAAETYVHEQRIINRIVFEATDE